MKILCLQASPPSPESLQYHSETEQYIRFAEEASFFDRAWCHPAMHAEQAAIPLTVFPTVPCAPLDKEKSENMAEHRDRFEKTGYIGCVMDCCIGPLNQMK